MSPIIISCVLLATALLISLILALATGVNRLQRISGIVLAPAAVCGLVIYSAAFVTPDSGPAEILVAVFRSVTATFSMFVGRAEYSAVYSSAEWFREIVIFQILFWAAHLGALFISASMILSTLGKKLIQTLRLFLLRSDKIYIIYGLHAQSVFLGRDIAKKGEGKVLYISPKPSSEHVEQVLAFGGAVRQEVYLPDGKLNKKLMHLLGIKENCRIKHAHILAFDDSETVNFSITRAAIDYFTEIEIAPDKVRVLLRCMRELDFAQLKQISENKEMGYCIDAFSEAELAARLLIKEAPPYKTIKFNKDGTAAEDFCGLIIGFGQVGQHALQKMIMNGQFVGSKFSAVVVDRELDAISGQFVRQHPSLFSEYNVKFAQMDTRSHAFYDLLDELAPKLSYIVVALGDSGENYEASVDLEHYFTRLCESKRPDILVNVCNKRNVSASQTGIRFFDNRQALYSADLLLRCTLDSMAKAVNLTYEEGEKSSADADDAWYKLNYFTRESNRASADFIPAMLHIAGISDNETVDEKLLEEKIPVGSALFETLGQTEKLRWNAFHYAMGYSKMPLDEVRNRAEKGIKPFQKDETNTLHACLVSWDELDEVSKVMTELSGKIIDYKEYDRRNIYNIPRTLSFIP